MSHTNGIQKEHVLQNVGHDLSDFKIRHEL